MSQYQKRFSVDLDGRIVAAFDSVEECRAWIDSHWWQAWASIWDQNTQEEIETWGRI